MFIGAQLLTNESPKQNINGLGVVFEWRSMIWLRRTTYVHSCFLISVPNCIVCETAAIECF